MSQKSRQKQAATPASAAAVPSLVVPVAKPDSGFFAKTWWQIKDFSGLNHTATYLWPRWLVLRAVGLVYLFVFGGIIADCQGLVGPHGISPLDEFFRQLSTLYPGTLRAFIGAPSLFWIDTSAGMIYFVAWLGFAAAVAVVLNLWPRMSLFICWLAFLSFVATWRIYSQAQLDNLMIEVALLCIPFAPAGYRPGLGVDSPPRPIALLMVRWILFRAMFEAGMVKITAGDPHWRNLTAMEVMYETSPFPTYFAYLDHQMPHFYHVFEIALTFAAEIVAPFLAIFAGRRGRWFAFFAWSIFQAGIQLTSNFGWLNTASFGLGFLLLDDQMIAAALDKLRLRKLKAFVEAKISAQPLRPLARWRLYSLRGALCLHFYFTLFFLAKACGLSPADVPASLAAPVDFFSNFHSANGYYLYARFDPVRYQVEFEGSNDGGATWRTYEYRYMPQREDEICPFIAPRYIRFESTIEISAWGHKKSKLFPVVASHLLARNPDVMAFFRSDPFADRPATIIRMRGYRFFFTDLETKAKTGKYWRKEPAGEYMPILYLDERGQISEANLGEADAALAGRRFGAAADIFTRQYLMGSNAAGVRLADMLARGIGMAPDPARAYALYSALARDGEVGAEHNLAVCFEYGVGTAIDYKQASSWYKRAGDHGYPLSYYTLGSLYARDLISPRNDVEGLTLLLFAAERTTGDDAMSRYIKQDQPAQVRRISARMSPGDIAKAQLAAADRIKEARLAAPPADLSGAGGAEQ